MPPETRFQELKRYVRLNERDSELLAEFARLATPHLPRVAREFYERIREHQEAAEALANDEQVERLQRSLVEWLGRVCSGAYDDAHYQQTLAVGRIHVRIGVPERYLVTAMALIRVALLRIADQELRTDSAPTREALARLLDLELSILLEAYRDAYLERIELAERRTSLPHGPPGAAEHRYESAFDFAGAIIVGLDREGRIQLFNREAERVSSYARDEVLDRPFLELLGPRATPAAIEQLLARALASDVPPDAIEGYLRTRSGRLRDVVWRLTAVGSGTDAVVLLVTGRDATAEKASEARARQTERLAAVGTLAAGLAHEIGNPLNGAKLHLSFIERAIKRKSTEAEMVEATQVVQQELTRLTRLVSDFLRFARPTPPDLKEIGLSQALEHARDLAAAKAKTGSVELVAELPSSDVEFPADRDKLTQVLLNLLHNAIDATSGQEGARVVVRGRRGPSAVLIEVEDNGPGLPDPAAPIFDAFYTTKPEGTGLGLAICHRIVTAHGGTIDVESRRGRTVFHIALPLKAEDGDAA
jgi:PAS domain S-box-containing protein